jgi:plastocyanin
MPPRLALLLLMLALPRAAGAASLDLKLTETRGGGVPDAVVSLRPADGRTMPALDPTPGATVRQEKQEFVPYVIAVTAGTTVGLPNDDTVEHHAYSLSPALKFDLPLYKPKMNQSLEFKTPGVVTIGCNIHDWMIAYVVVLDTPWFGTSSAAGSVTIPEVPAGRYTATIWHPRLAKEVTQEITVTAAAAPAQTVLLNLRPDRRIRRPAEGTGGGYR